MPRPAPMGERSGSGQSVGPRAHRAGREEKANGVATGGCPCGAVEQAAAWQHSRLGAACQPGTRGQNATWAASRRSGPPGVSEPLMGALAAHRAQGLPAGPTLCSQHQSCWHPVRALGLLSQDQAGCTAAREIPAGMLWLPSRVRAGGRRWDVVTGSQFWTMPLRWLLHSAAFPQRSRVLTEGFGPR